MMRFCRYQGAMLALLVLAGPVAARPPQSPLAEEYSYRVWRVQDGLPQNRIQVISQTRDGYLWIGTAGGLARFDGARFFLFDRSNTPAFRDDSILALCPSRDGSLWIGTEGGGLLHYRGGTFSSLGNDAGLTNGFVRALYEDPAGTLWIGTDRGFFRLRTGRIERLDDRNGIPVTAVFCIRPDGRSRIWAGGGIGLLRADNGVLSRYEPSGGSLKNVLGVVQMRDGALWLFTPHGTFRLSEGALAPVRGLEGVGIVTSAGGARDELWGGTLDDRLIRITGAGVRSYRGGALPSNTVRAVFLDRERNLWVGTHAGLLRLGPKVVHTLGPADGLQDENISAVYASRDGVLWLTSISGAIYRFSGGKVRRFRLPPPFGGIRVRTVYQDSRGTLWIGTFSHGIVRLADGDAVSFTTDHGLRSNDVRQFLESRSGDLWIAFGSGLSRWDGRHFQNYYVEDGLPYGSVRSLLELRGGDILVGTDAGLGRVHEGRFISDRTLASLNGERVWTMYEDADGALWVGTRGGGLFRIRDEKAAAVTVRQGLRSNTVYQILGDLKGNLWMSGPAGVSCAALRDLNRVADGDEGPVPIISYGSADGMDSPHMNGGTGWGGVRMASGDLWFAGVKGAVRIDSTARPAPPPPPVLIESVVADERPLLLSGAIRIPAGSRKLGIDFTACSLLSPEHISFRYMLEGFDNGWVFGSTHRSARYTNLHPGHYRFRVQAVDSAMPAPYSEASVALIWEPHFYQTPWFYGVCAALAGACIWAALAVYTRQTRARYAVLMAERTRLARELHDTVIQGCVGVSSLLEAASAFHSLDGGRSRELVGQARVAVRNTLDEARQAVWDLRHPDLEGNLAALLPEFARQLSQEKRIPIDVETEGNSIALDTGAVRSILMVAREAIRNSAGHGDPRLIRIRLTFSADQVRLDVKDDGCGFVPDGDAPEMRGRYGILGMRERIAQMGGQFTLDSAPGQGTFVAICLPLRRCLTNPERRKVHV